MEFLSLDGPPAAIPETILKYPFGLQPPTGRTRLIHASQHPIIPPSACQYLIESAMETTDRIGWTKDWHVQAPTCDVPIFDLSESTHRWVRTSFQEVLFPLLCQIIAPELDIRPEDLRVQDCFISDTIMERRMNVPTQALWALSH